MPVPILRRALALALLTIAAATLPACREQTGGAPNVLVIGEQPKLRDPAAGPLSAPDAVLLATVAQGLVRFDPAGNIVGGLAERWNVSDDGLSYIFRIASAEWPDGRKITAQQVARALKRQLASRSDNALKDSLGAVEDVVAMTDRVIEIRLRTPRPNLLALLAQPEFAILREGQGTGPFEVAQSPEGEARLHLIREFESDDGEPVPREELWLGGARSAEAIGAFARGDADLVLGGTFADLPLARSVRLPRNSLRFDPASGLFGLRPARADGPLAEPEARRLLAQAIDREAFIAALEVPGLGARATVLERGLDGTPPPVQPAWFATPLADRRAALLADANRLFGEDKPTVRLFLPDGTGADLLFSRLAADWGALGLAVERAESARRADLRLVDLVAPSSSPAWFLRQFRCGTAAVCDEEADALLEAARDAPIPAQRYALLAQAAALIDEAQLFLPITAPVRWSLVASRIQGFAGNRYARHTLTQLGQDTGAGE